MAALSTFFVLWARDVTLLRAAERRDGFRIGAVPLRHQRDDGAHEADDGVANKMGYFHGVDDDKKRRRQGDNQHYLLVE